VKKFGVVAGVIIVALIPALTLAGQKHGLALLVYTLVIAALGLAFLVDLLNRALPRKAFSWSPSRRAPRADQPIVQFEKVERALIAASWNESHLHELLRPLVREIVVARLRRHHRIDLKRAPERAHAVAGDGYVWALVRPERKPPRGPGGRGWSRDELEQLLDELETL